MIKIKDFILNFKNKFQVLFKLIWMTLLFLVILLAYEILVPLAHQPDNNGQVIRTAMIIIPTICLGIGCYLKGRGKLTIEIAALLVMISGFALRMGYAFYSGANTRQHDVEMYNNVGLNINGAGHFSYTYIIYSTWSLPSKIEWQFYHPPLWHSLVAIWMHIYSFFSGVKDVAILYNAGMIVSSFVGCLTLYGFKKIIFEVTNNNTIRFISLLLLAFHSQFFIVSGWMNNDGLALLFMVFAIYYAIKFYKDDKWSSLILCAFMIGLGMMSKFNVALICLPIAPLFIIKFINSFKDKTVNKIVIKYLSFIGIIIPLGFWFIIRNVLTYGITSIGVPRMDPYQTAMGVIKYNIWERFGLFNPFDWANKSIYCHVWPTQEGYLDYNVWLYTAKCSIFGEYSYWQGDLYASTLLLLNMIMMALTIIAIIFVYIKQRKEKDRIMEHIMLLIFGVSIVAYIIFQIGYPVTCTQDFRYMTIILLPGVYFIAKAYQLIEKKEHFIYKIISTSTLMVIVLFAMMSMLTFVSVR